MEGTIGIEGEKYLSRDLSSKAILNSNTKEIAKYKEQTKKLEETKRISLEIETLKQDVGEIKALLKALLLKE